MSSNSAFMEVRSFSKKSSGWRSSGAPGPPWRGEFTLRAYLSGRLDILQAEAVDDLIKANSPAQAKLAYRGIEGALSKKIDGLRRRRSGRVARIEAEIEFPERRPSLADRASAVIIDRMADLDRDADSESRDRRGLGRRRNRGPGRTDECRKIDVIQ